jgi:hypothetical protein
VTAAAAAAAGIAASGVRTSLGPRKLHFKAQNDGRKTTRAFKPSKQYFIKKKH